jgi:hypothetical protein
MIFDAQLALQGKKRAQKLEVTPMGHSVYREIEVKISGSPIEISEKHYEEELERWLAGAADRRDDVRKAFERCYKVKGTVSKWDVKEDSAKQKAGKLVKPTKTRVARKPRSAKGDKNELKPKAFEIFQSLKETSHSNSDKAKIIADRLGITYANAYYYVSRVFAKV